MKIDNQKIIRKHFKNNLEFMSSHSLMNILSKQKQIPSIFITSKLNNKTYRRIRMIMYKLFA